MSAIWPLSIAKSDSRPYVALAPASLKRTTVPAGPVSGSSPKFASVQKHAKPAAYGVLGKHLDRTHVDTRGDET